MFFLMRSVGNPYNFLIVSGFTNIQIKICNSSKSLLVSNVLLTIVKPGIENAHTNQLKKYIQSL